MFTKDHGLHYGKVPADLEGYSDANWIADSKNSKIHEWIHRYTWRCSSVLEIFKQTLAAKSTMASEFIALDTTTAETEWLRNFWKTSQCGENLCLQYMYTIANRLYEGHKVPYIIVNFVT